MNEKNSLFGIFFGCQVEKTKENLKVHIVNLAISEWFLREVLFISIFGVLNRSTKRDGGPNIGYPKKSTRGRMNRISHGWEAPVVALQQPNRRLHS